MQLTKGFLAGLLFVAIGGTATIIAFSYRMGTSTEMGPGYFPVMLGLAVAGIGLVLAVRSWLFPDGSPPVERLHMRPLLLIFAGLLSFGLLVRSLGLAPAIVALLIFGRLAGREGSALEFVMMLIVLTALPIAIFIYGLKLPLDIWAN